MRAVPGDAWVRGAAVAEGVEASNRDRVEISRVTLGEVEGRGRAVLLRIELRGKEMMLGEGRATSACAMREATSACRGLFMWEAIT